MKIYGKSNCPWCDKAKSLLLSYGLEFEYVDVGSNPDKLVELKALLPDVKTVPQIFENGIHIGDYTTLYAKIISEFKNEDFIDIE
jgi:glutaredoxin